MDPNWVAAIGQWVGAIATFAAVVVALYIAHSSGKQARGQVQQARVDSVRPMLVINEYDGQMKTSTSNPAWLAWDNPFLNLKVRNIGMGAALNIACVLYGAESYWVGDIPNQKQVNSESDKHWTCWFPDSIGAGEVKEQSYKIGASTFYEPNKQIGGHSFNAPAQPPFSMNPSQSTYICRVTLTYHDIFKNKYASFFDLRLQPPGWEHVAFEEKIKKDLHDLEGH